MAWIRTLPRKVGGTVELFYCMECESFSSPFSPPVANPPTEVNWHKTVLDRNLKWSDELLSKLSDKGVTGPMVDIGCGIGSLLEGAKRRGISGIGFDLDVEACAYGREAFGLDLRGELWSRDKTGHFGLISCISVLEHVHQPRALITEMIQTARDYGAHAYLSVPLINRDWWRFLHTDNLTPGHMFEVPHAHVTHFSNLGMRTLLEQLGVQNVDVVSVDKGWVGYLVTP